MEITDFAESHLNGSSERILDINKIDEIYKGILLESSTATENLTQPTKNT